MFNNKNNPTMNELVNWFQVHFHVLADSMGASTHHAVSNEPNPYHGEGPVWTHTMMVCLRAENENANKIVSICALLHDIGKPEARDVIPFEAKKPVHSESNEIRNAGKEDGKTSGLNNFTDREFKTHFRGHEGLSFYRAIEIVNKLEDEGILDVEEKIQILTIISLHGTLFDSIKDGEEYKPEKVVAKFRDYTLFKNFVSQVRNDSTGRFFASKDGRKNQAFRLGNEIYNNITFTTYNQKRLLKELENNPLQDPKLNKSSKHYLGPKITVLSGPPAVGKSTWRDKHQGDAVVISRDDTMMKYAKDEGIIGTEIVCEHCKGNGHKVFTDPVSYDEVLVHCSHCKGSSGYTEVETYSQVWKYLEDNDLHKEIDKLEREQFDKAKQARKNIIIDRTNMSRKSRRSWLTQVPKEYKKEAVVFATVYEDIYSRNKKRAEDTGKIIPNDVIGKMMRQFMVPTYDEVDNIVWVF